MFSEIKHYIPQFKYCGTFYRFIQYKTGDELLITTDRSVNKHQIKVHFYLNGRKIKSMRFNKDGFKSYHADQTIVAVYWDYISSEQIIF